MTSECSLSASLIMSASSLNADGGVKQEKLDGYGITERSHFTPLNPGEIRPLGWIKDQAVLASKGLTGQRDVLDNNIWRHASETRKKSGSSSWWPYEQDAYHMDGVTRLAHTIKDQKLLDGVDKTYNSVADRQLENGYYFCDNDTWRKGWIDKDKGDDNYRWEETGFEGMHWSKAVVVRGILAHYEATGDVRMLELLRKHFRYYDHKGRDANKVDKVITGFELYQNRGLVTMESVVEFLRLTEDKQIYDQAVEIFKKNENGMVKNYLNGKFSTICHGVTYNELTKLYAAGYLLTGNKDYLKATEASYEFLQNNHMQPNGIHTSNEFLRGIGAFKASETCNIADFSWSNIWMLRASGKRRYADRIENCFYNAAQRMASFDYKTHVYLQTPNHIPEIEIEHSDKKTKYEKCHRPLCCVRNLTRVLPNFIIHMCMRTNDGLGLILYGPSKVDTIVNGKAVKFEVVTDYPFNDKVNVTFKQEGSVDFPLTLRIPEWCNNPVVKINDKIVETDVSGGFIVVKRDWYKNDTLTLVLPMNVEVTKGQEQIIIERNGKEGGQELFCRAHGPDLHVDSFTKGAEFAYVKRGPLTFSLPLKSLDDAKNALVLSDSKASAKVTLNPIPTNWTWGDESPVTIEVMAQSIDWNLISGKPEMPMKPFAASENNKHKVTLIPYGSTDYRLTMFPVVE